MITNPKPKGELSPDTHLMLTMSIECSRFLEHPCPFVLTGAHTAVDLLTRHSLCETTQLVKVTEHALGRELVGGERAKESQHRQKIQGKTARTSVVNCNFYDSCKW